MSGIGVGISPSFLPFFPTSYAAKVLAVESADLIGYWPMWELSGAVADNYEGTAARDGAFTGVTLGQVGIGDGRTCPLFDGANDYCDVYSVGLRDVFDGGEGAMMAWAKVSGAGVWSDATARRVFILRVDPNNRIYFGRATDANTLEFRYEAAGTDEYASVGGQSSTDWMQLAVTWSALADEVKYYLNGAQVGSTKTLLGIWAGLINSNNCVLGAGSATPSAVWDGYAAHGAVWKKPLTAAQILELSTV